MENASKALLMAVSILISIMIFSFMWYVFRRTSFFSATTEDKINDEILAFNSQFLKYETNSYWNGKSNLSTNSDRIRAANELNTISDVLTVVNLAYEINSKNNNYYKYNQLEEVNSLEVIIEIGKVNFDNNIIYKYYLLEPNSGARLNCVYGFNSIGNTKTKRIIDLKNNIENSSRELNVYKLLEIMRETKSELNSNTGSDYIKYKYYFSGNLVMNEEIKKIETIKFKLIVDKNF